MTPELCLKTLLMEEEVDLALDCTKATSALVVVHVRPEDEEG